jgi:hypothetical protein
MRYYHPVTSDVVEMRRPHLHFFLLGPFYLAWLRLWIDAAVTAAAGWVVLHGTLLLAQDVSGRPVGLQSAIEAVGALGAAADLGQSADAALQRFIAATLPFYVAGTALLFVATMAAMWAPQFLAWRFRRMGYIPLREEAVEPVF